ncbi:MAG TPA: universal stress protein [Acidimicrobiia bacterium]|nr:universal stress protein [Acidimicrobiia bacterium]
MSTIVVPVVKTPAGVKAIALAKEEARARDAEILLIGHAVVNEDLPENLDILRDFLTELEKQLLDEGFRCRSEWSVGGSLASATVEAAKNSDVELIVLGIRQRSSVGKAILGSYEQEVLLDAPCPVLSVRAPVRR